MCAGELDSEGSMTSVAGEKMRLFGWKLTALVRLPATRVLQKRALRTSPTGMLSTDYSEEIRDTSHALAPQPELESIVIVPL